MDVVGTRTPPDHSKRMGASFDRREPGRSGFTSPPRWRYVICRTVKVHDLDYVGVVTAGPTTLIPFKN
jgi:hypothetical protein